VTSKGGTPKGGGEAVSNLEAAAKSLLQIRKGNAPDQSLVGHPVRKEQTSTFL